MGTFGTLLIWAALGLLCALMTLFFLWGPIAEFRSLLRATRRRR